MITPKMRLILVMVSQSKNNSLNKPFIIVSFNDLLHCKDNISYFNMQAMFGFNNYFFVSLSILFILCNAKDNTIGNVQIHINALNKTISKVDANILSSFLSAIKYDKVKT